MFTTYRSSEVQLPHEANFRFAETQSWPYVEQDLMYPWFYLKAVRESSLDKDAYMLMIQHATDVASLVRRKSSRWWIEQVQIVTPDHMNGTGRWLMEPVRRISLHNSPSLGGQCESFEVESGKCYTLAGSGVLENATLIQVIFDAATDLKNPTR